MSAIQDIRYKRAAESVKRHATEISKELLENERAVKNQQTTQSLLWECVALGYLWRACVATLGDLDDAELNYRQLGDTLRSAADMTVEIYGKILVMAKKCADNGLSIEGFKDIELSAHEAQNLKKWLLSWPTSGPSNRIAARKHIARGETQSIEDFVSDLESAS